MNSGLKDIARTGVSDQTLHCVPRFDYGVMLSLPRTISRPSRISRSLALETRPTCSVMTVRSIETICVTLATESFGRPVWRLVRVTFPGAAAHRRLLVRGTTTTVAGPLEFRESPWMTRTGYRRPGPDSSGSGSDAQKMSPWAITTRFSLVRGDRLETARDPSDRFPPEPGPWPQ